VAGLIMIYLYLVDNYNIAVADTPKQLYRHCPHILFFYSDMGLGNIEV
jgi:hypothetical protein